MPNEKNADYTSSVVNHQYFCRYYTVGSNFSSGQKNAFSYANVTWNNVTNGPIDVYRSSPDNSATEIDLNDVNEVSKRDIGDDSFLMETTRWVTGETIVEFDITVNTNSAVPWSTSGAANYYDMQNVATHEIGHALYAGDIYFASDVQEVYQSEWLNVTMYGYVAKGETKKRSLHQDDIDGFLVAY